jgi:hypothetical protein
VLLEPGASIAALLSMGLVLWEIGRTRYAQNSPAARSDVSVADEKRPNESASFLARLFPMNQEEWNARRATGALQIGLLPCITPAPEWPALVGDEHHAGDLLGAEQCQLDGGHTEAVGGNDTDAGGPDSLEKISQPTGQVHAVRQFGNNEPKSAVGERSGERRAQCVQPSRRLENEHRTSRSYSLIAHHVIARANLRPAVGAITVVGCG